MTVLSCRVPAADEAITQRAAPSAGIDVDVRLSRERRGWSLVGIVLIPGCCDMATFTSRDSLLMHFI